MPLLGRGLCKIDWQEVRLMQTMGQKRAAFALNAIIEITSGMNDPNKQKKEFKSFTAGDTVNDSPEWLWSGPGIFFLRQKQRKDKYEESFYADQRMACQENNHFAPNSST
jgi:hypothetical protein